MPTGPQMDPPSCSSMTLKKQDNNGFKRVYHKLICDFTVPKSSSLIHSMSFTHERH